MQKAAPFRGGFRLEVQKNDGCVFVSVILGRLSGAFLLNCELFALTLLFALPLGLVVSFGSMSRCKPLSAAVKTFVWIIRGTPLMLQIIVIYLGPGLLGMSNPWPSGSGGRMVAAVVAFAINYACYFSEIYRGGIESIPAGQYEAANVLGYTKAQTFLRIILPQVVKRVMPSVTNEVVTLVKDTSMAFTVSYQEMFTIGKQIANSQTSFTPFLVAGVFYFVFNAIVDFVMGKIEKRMDYYK